MRSNCVKFTEVKVEIAAGEKDAVHLCEMLYD